MSFAGPEAPYHTRALKRLALPLLLLSLPTLAGDLVVRDAWIRAAPPGAVVLAGYATLENRGKTKVSVVGAESRAFARAELHTMRTEDGVMRMRPLAALPVPPGETVALAPGANHLMLRSPKRAVAKGDRIVVELVDDEGTRTAVSFDVR